MTEHDGTTPPTTDASIDEEPIWSGSGGASQEDNLRIGTESAPDTNDLITLVRRAPALAALREQPLDRRDLEQSLDLSKPTVHRLTKTLKTMGLVERPDGVFVLTALGETVADVVAKFTGGVETAYRLAPLLESPRYQEPTLDVEAFDDATVTTAGPADSYGPLRRYCSLIEETETLHGFETTLFSPEYVDTGHQQICDGMETEVILPPAIVSGMRSTYPKKRAEIVAARNFDIRIHDDLSYGLAIFDERIGIGGYSETTGALETFIDTNSKAAREWAETTYESYWNEAEPLSKSSVGT